MDIEKLKELILNKFPGVYLENNIEVVISGIQKMDQSIKVELEKFLETGEISDIQVQGYTVDRLIKEQGMNEVAAFLTLDWIKREPEKALSSMGKGHDFVRN